MIARLSPLMLFLLVRCIFIIKKKKKEENIFLTLTIRLHFNLSCQLFSLPNTKADLANNFRGWNMICVCR